jgi:hypothetical protein
MAIKFDNALTEIPETDASKAGETFYYRGELWRYLTDGETGLPAGTPWPSKGYKEHVAYWVFDGANVPNVLELLKDDFGGSLNIAVTDAPNFEFQVRINTIPASAPLYISFGTNPDVSDRLPAIKLTSAGANDFSTGFYQVDDIWAQGAIETTNGQLVDIRQYPPSA